MGRSVAKGRRGKTKEPEPGLFARLGRGLRFLVTGVEDGEGGGSDTSDHVQEIKALLLIGLSLFLSISILTYWRPMDDPDASGRNWGGEVGFYLANAALMATGIAGGLLGVLGFAWGLVLLARKHVSWASVRILGAVSFVVSLGFLIQLGLGDDIGPGPRLPYGAGGWLALQATPTLQAKFGVPGLWILMSLTALVSFMLATEMAFWPALRAFGEWAERRREERGESLAQAVVSWSKQIAFGLWDFVRGAGIGETAAALATETDAPAPAKKRRKPARPAPEPVDEEEPEEEEEDEEAYDDEDDEEYDEDEDAEYDEDEEYEYEDEEDEDEEYDEEDEPEDVEEVEVRPAAKAKAKSKPTKATVTQTLPFEPPMPPPGPWKLPPGDLLEAPDRDVAADSQKIEAAAAKLENALQSFRVDATVVAARIGPTVILFELEVSQGTRMNKVTQLSQEIAAALRAQSVRIIAPIPGKATIGIEVPNNVRRIVRISELVSQKAYDKKFAALPLFIGVDAEGQAIVEDLARMPHLLVAGTTGSGKSVCINTILASFLLTRSPHDVQLILIDPKMVELQAFANIPHMMLPVVTDMRHATNVLNWAVEKMEGRYELFKDAGVRNIKSYNALGEDALKERLGEKFNEERTPRHVPYIVLVIDEFADLMMASKKEAEQAITRLAQKSRAVGIHVILATQRPSTDVITGVIKGNLPTRIAFQVASKVDSRVILDSVGAEKLLGGGDMLYNPPGTSKINRVQGALVEDHELTALIDFVCKEAAPSFNQELVQVATGTAQPGAGGGFETALEDDLWDEAVRTVLKSKRGSASLLQRALGIGYTRASRLLDMMSEAGIVSEHKGSKAREVLLTLEEWDEQSGVPG